MLPLHAFGLLCMGRFSPRLYVAYSTFYAVGTLSSMQVPFVGFQPIQTSEHMAAFGVFGLLQLVAAVEWVRGMVPGKQFKLLLRGFLIVAAILGAGAITAATKMGWIRGWTGRFYSLFDTGYAKIHIPIVSRCIDRKTRRGLTVLYKDRLRLGASADSLALLLLRP